MPAVPLTDLVNSLNSIPEKYFSFETVADCLKSQPVEDRSLQPYLFSNPQRYTRNLIFKNDQFELLASCWGIGQSSPVHSYPGRNCWIMVSAGQLRLQTFRVAEENEQTGYGRLEWAKTFDLQKHSLAVVGAADPVHQVLNLPQFLRRAVSLHLYSPPVAEQVIYLPKENQRSTVRAAYDSRHGRYPDMPE